MFFEESVKIGATKRLKDWIFVDHKTLSIILSKQSDSTSACLHTSSSRFSDKVSFKKIYVLKQNIEC